MGAERWCSTTSVALVGVFALVVVAEHVMQPENGVLRHMVSEYATGDHAAVMSVGFAAWACSLAAAAAALPSGGSPVACGLRLALLAAAGAIAIVTVFPTQTVAGVLPPGVVATRAGALHDRGGEALLAALVAAAALSGAVGWRSRAARRVTGIGVLAATACAVALAVVGAPVAGLRQRVLLAAALAWQVALLLWGPVARPAVRTPDHAAPHRRSRPRQARLDPISSLARATTEAPESAPAAPRP